MTEPKRGFVIPAKAGIQTDAESLDPGLRIAGVTEEQIPYGREL